MTVRNIILVDIDHTVSDAAWRDDLINEKDWDRYHQESVRDLPCTDVIRLLLALKAGGNFKLVGLTARPEKWRQLTNSKLFEFGCPLDDLIMRDDDDYRKSPEMKVAMAEEYCNGDLDCVAFILDDREDVCAAFRARNITALQVHSRTYLEKESNS